MLGSNQASLGSRDTHACAEKNVRSLTFLVSLKDKVEKPFGYVEAQSTGLGVGRQSLSFHHTGPQPFSIRSMYVPRCQVKLHKLISHLLFTSVGCAQTRLTSHPGWAPSLPRPPFLHCEPSTPGLILPEEPSILLEFSEDRLKLDVCLGSLLTNLGRSP